MRASDIQKSAQNTVRKYGLWNEDDEGLVDKIKTAIKDAGYTIVEYSNISDDEDVRVIVETLGLAEACQKTRGFIYADSQNRLVFVNADLTNTEKSYVLIHELGHIMLGHSKSGLVFGNDVTEEYEAGEFLHYVKNPSFAFRLRSMATSHKKIICAIIVALVAILFAFWKYSEYRESLLYDGEYYVTDTGSKYHLKGCFYIKGKDVRRLTHEDMESRHYEPCSICIPLE